MVDANFVARLGIPIRAGFGGHAGTQAAGGRAQQHARVVYRIRAVPGDHYFGGGVAAELQMQTTHRRGAGAVGPNPDPGDFDQSSAAPPTPAPAPSTAAAAPVPSSARRLTPACSGSSVMAASYRNRVNTDVTRCG